MLDRSLTDVVERLSAAPRSERARALLFEAKRLKSAMTSWHAVQPTPDALSAMVARVVDLATALRTLSFPPDD